MELQDFIAKNGVEETISKYCALDKNSMLAKEIQKMYLELNK